MTRASVFTAIAMWFFHAVPGAAQNLERLGAPDVGIEVETLVLRAEAQGFARVDSVAALDVDLASGERLRFGVEGFDGGYQYLVLVFTTRCPECRMGLEIADLATGQYAQATSLEVHRSERMNLGLLYVDQRASTRGRLSAFAEGGPHRMLAMLLRKPL